MSRKDVERKEKTITSSSSSPSSQGQTPSVPNADDTATSSATTDSSKGTSYNYGQQIEEE